MQPVNSSFSSSSHPPLDMLSLACKTKDIDFVHLAISKGAIPDSQTLTWACKSGSIDIINEVALQGALPDNETLNVACSTRQVAIVKLALFCGANASTKSLELAHKTGNIEIFNLIKTELSSIASRALPVIKEPNKEKFHPSKTAPIMTHSNMPLWREKIGDPGIEPPLPKNIEQIVSASCPFWPNKKVYETHVLCLIPETINGRPLNLDYFVELTENLLKSMDTIFLVSHKKLSKYSSFIQAPSKSHWVLITKDIIPGSVNKTFKEQQALVSLPYELPSILDTTICAITEYIRGRVIICEATRCCDVKNDLFCGNKRFVYLNRPSSYYDSLWDDLKKGEGIFAGLNLEPYRATEEYKPTKGSSKNYIDICLDDDMKNNLGICAVRKLI